LLLSFQFAIKKIKLGCTHGDFLEMYRLLAPNDSLLRPNDSLLPPNNGLLAANNDQSKNISFQESPDNSKTFQNTQIILM